ncbi:Dihydroorotase [Clavibacter michiganensis subsp. michiganensis]|nr:Dihydroorotase [Clavibacter michiganensis subsp. michiganensis]
MTQNDTNPDDTHLIRGATLPSGERADILVADGLIREIGPDLETPAGAHVIEADGLVALPGLVDLHVHLREPGYEQSETVLTGSRAAALGGFTAVFAMANTMPVQDTAGVVEQVKALGDAAGYATVRPIGAVSVGLAGSRWRRSARWPRAARPSASSPTTGSASRTRCSCVARSST